MVRLVITPFTYGRRVTKDQQDSHCWLLAATHCLRFQIRVFGCLQFFFKQFYDFMQARLAMSSPCS